MALLQPKEPCTELFLQGKKAPLIIRLVLIIIMIISLLGSLALILGALTNHIATGPAFLVLIFALVAGGIFFLKLVLWNTYGREIIALYAQRIVYQADYKLFRNSGREFPIDGMNIEITDTEFEPGYGRILFTCGEQKLRTVLMIPIEKLKSLVGQVESHFNLSRINP